MAMFRSVLLVCLISLAAAAGLFYLGSSMGYEEFRGGYAVLITDESVNDRDVRVLLDANDSVFEGGIESESSQWVLLDEFDSVQMIPLDKYFSRIFTFDPRYDSYAETLKNVFVRDGSRFFYIPLKAGNWNSKVLDGQFNDIFYDIPFSVDYYGIGRPVRFYFFSYAAASLLLLIICIFYRKRCRPVFLVLVPVLSSLAFFGVPGIAFAALMLALFILLKDPLNDLITQPPGAFKKVFFRYKFRWLCLPLFFFAVSVILYNSQMELSFFLTAFFTGTAVFVFSLILLFLPQKKHRHFTPVMIIRRRAPDFSYSLFMLPFAAAAFTVMFFAPYMSASYEANKQFDAFIDEHAYYAHVNNQTSFSIRQMSTSSSLFPNFNFDADSLPSISAAAGKDRSVSINEFPPFPLRDLMDFFHNVNSGHKTNTNLEGIFESIFGGITEYPAEKLSLLVLLLFILPPMFIKRNIEYSAEANLNNHKRNNERETLRGKLRLAGINGNKKLIYNEYVSRIRKDA